MKGSRENSLSSVNDVDCIELLLILVPTKADALEIIHLPRKVEGFGT
jgi:hypothetical protein